MSNIQVSIKNEDKSVVYPHEFGESGKHAVHTLYSDDFAAPPKFMQIEIKTESGKTVKVMIPYDHTSKTSVSIDGNEI